MANTPINTLEKSVKIYNPYALFVTPFVRDTESNTEVRGLKTYKLSEVIRDTTTISQDDPTENRVENEFSSAPIINPTTLGSYTFSAEVADMQPDLLEALCGYKKGKGKTDRVYAPANYTAIYAEIALVFNAGKNTAGEDTYVAAVMPKVQLNSKATFDSLSTSMGRITLAGTGLNISISDGSDNPAIESPFYLDMNWSVNEL